MLLRRVIEHVKAQNWTAVALDFLIVVMGVFIGLQVANWNAARQARTDEQAALEELLAEAEVNVGMLKAQVEAYDTLNAERDALTAKLTSGDLDGVSAEDVGRLIGDSRQYPRITSVTTVYDGLVGSGVAGALSQRHAVQSTSHYHSMVDDLANAADNFQDFTIAEYPHFSEYPGVRAVHDPADPLRRRYDVDLMAFTADERTMEDIVSLNRNQFSFQGIRRAQLQAAEIMCADLAAVVGRACKPVQFTMTDNGALVAVE